MITFKQYIFEIDTDSVNKLIKKNEELIKNPANDEQKVKAENEIKRLKQTLINDVN